MSISFGTPPTPSGYPRMPTNVRGFYDIEMIVYTVNAAVDAIEKDVAQIDRRIARLHRDIDEFFEKQAAQNQAISSILARLQRLELRAVGVGTPPAQPAPPASSSPSSDSGVLEIAE